MAGMDYVTVEVRDLAPGVVEVKIGGALDWSNYAKVEAAIEEVFRRGVRNLVVNLADAQYISSAGFGCFIKTVDQAMQEGGKVVFAGTPPHILEVFGMLGLSKILHLADSVQEGLEAIR